MTATTREWGGLANMPLIEIRNLTKDYGNGRGVFDLNLTVEKGETFGFVGANGAGKTTTIRHLMGFIKPDGGNATIDGLDCWKDAAELKKRIGYIPGEIAFPDAPTGSAFLKRQAELRGVKDMALAESVIRKMQLDPTANLKRMSKGMKQKTAIVAALMADCDILIFDEPTTGLDPLMRAEFLDLLRDLKNRGKTIFMSTHVMEEVEQICDRVAFIRDGKLVAVKSMDEFRNRDEKTYQITFQTREDYRRFLSEAFDFAGTDDGRNLVTVRVRGGGINALLKTLKAYRIQSLSEVKQTFEKYVSRLIRGGDAQ